MRGQNRQLEVSAGQAVLFTSPHTCRAIDKALKAALCYDVVDVVGDLSSHVP